MRPRKRVLVYCADATALAVLAYAMEIRLRVRCDRASKPTAALRSYDAALVVRSRSGDGAETMARELSRRGVPVLLHSREEVRRPSAATVITMVRARNIDVIEVLKALLAPQRGPKAVQSRPERMAKRAAYCKRWREAAKAASGKLPKPQRARREGGVE